MQQNLLSTSNWRNTSFLAKRYPASYEHKGSKEATTPAPDSTGTTRPIPWRTRSPRASADDSGRASFHTHMRRNAAWRSVPLWATHRLQWHPRASQRPAAKTVLLYLMWHFSHLLKAQDSFTEEHELASQEIQQFHGAVWENSQLISESEWNHFIQRYFLYMHMKKALLPLSWNIQIGFLLPGEFSYAF